MCVGFVYGGPNGYTLVCLCSTLSVTFFRKVHLFISCLPFLHSFGNMTDTIARISEYLVVLRGDDLESHKRSTLTALLGDEKHESILECFEKHGWDGERFSCFPNLSELDELLCTIGSIPRTPDEPSEIYA